MHAKLNTRLLLLALSGSLSLGYAADPQTPSSEAAQWHRDHQQASEGISIGEIQGTKRTYDSAGHMSAEGDPVSQDTLYEIGSITKVFTGVLLADTVLRGLADLDDSIGKHLPEGVLQDNSPLHQVTLLELSTHTSGLPRLPSDLNDGADQRDPYAHYSQERLFKYLGEFSEGDFKNRGEYSYSNLGVGLLGEILGLINETEYAELIADRILIPLDMASTWIQVSENSEPKKLKSRFASGHNGGKPVPYWRLNAFSGAGAMVSSVDDLLNFAEAHWSKTTPEYIKNALTFAMESYTEETGLGWHRSEEGEFSHGGGTGGFRTLLTVQPKAQYAKVNLRNSSGEAVAIKREGDFSRLAGFWTGTIDLGSNSLRTVLRITESGEAVFYSIDQGGSPIPSSKVVFQDDELKISFPSNGGSYHGKIEGEELKGSWTQGQSIELNFAYSKTMPDALVEIFDRVYSGELDRLEGYWQGTLGDEKSGLFVYLQVLPVGENRHEIAIMSPMQSPLPIPVTKVELKGDQFFVGSAIIQGTFQGTLDSDAQVLDGIWNQGVDQPIRLTWSPEKPRLEE